MGRLPSLLLLCATAALGQSFSALATNRDGSVLYFSSAARMKGTSQFLHPKIFKWDAVNGVSLFEQRPSDLPYPQPRSLWEGANFYSLLSSDVSNDGSVVTVTGESGCYGTSYCVWLRERYATTVYTVSSSGKASFAAGGLGSVSPNGRYVLLTSSSWIQFSTATLPMTLLDLSSGQTTTYPSQGLSPAPGSRHRVANDGTVVLRSSDGLSIVNAAQSKLIPNSSSPFVQRAMINDIATVVVFESPTSLAVYSAATGSTNVLVSAQSSTAFRSSISDDGSQVVFIYGADQQVYIVGSDGKGLRQLTSLGQAVIQIAISGDGKVLFAVTADGALLRIDVGTGTSRQLVPPTPFLPLYVSSLSAVERSQTARGSVFQVSGSGFATQAQQATAPYPLTLNGVELRINGVPIPVASVAPDSISFVVPWDVHDGPFDVEIWVSAAAASPFVPGIEAAPTFPWFALLSAIHQDFSSLVTQEDPANPGEIVHLYAYDLGPVNPPPTPGLPVPLQPLSMLTTPLTCFFGTPPGVPVEVVFAGLAPTMVGVVQIDVRLPQSGLSANAGRIGCELGDPAAQNYIPGFWPLVWLSGSSSTPN